MVQWLEEPNNQAVLRRGSGFTKKAALASLVSQLPSKSSQQVVDKYGNIKKSYSKAAQMNDQPGWGLGEEDLAEGKATQRSKLLSACPFFFRLDAIWGNKSNVMSPVAFIPPVTFESGSCSDGAQDLGNDSGLRDILDSELSRTRTDDDRQRLPSCSSTPLPLGRNRSNPATKVGRRRAIPRPAQLSDSEDDEGIRTRKKKKSNLTLGDAIVELSAAWAKGDQLKYSLLEKQLAQQKEQDEKEFELKKRRLDIEQEKAKAETLKYQLLLAQLQRDRHEEENMVDLEGL